MKKVKHVNPKIFLHKVYTEEGGVKEHDNNQQTIGALKFAGVIWGLVKIRGLLDKIENTPIKALEKKDEDNKC